MHAKRALQEPLVQRLFFLFFVLGLVPTVLLILAPTIYITLHGTESLGQSLLLMWGAQGVTFLIIVLVGASVTLKRLVLPIQELVRGAQSIAGGNLAYRVPVSQHDKAFVLLSTTFNEMADSIETMRRDLDHQHALLQAALNERENEFDAILAIARLVNHPGDLHSTIEEALQITHKVLQAHTISIALLDDSGAIASILCVCAGCTCEAPARCDWCSRKQLLRQSVHMMQSTLLRASLEQGRKIHINDIYQNDYALDSNLQHNLAALGVGKFSIKPLITRGRTLGFLIPMRPGSEDVPPRSPALLQALAENIVVLIENWQLQSKSRALAIMEERRFMASELHDSVTQSLFTLSLTARGMKAALENVPGVDHKVCELLVDQTKIIQAEMRNLINELRPIDIDAGDLENALHQHSHSLRRSAGAAVEFTTHGDARSLPLPIQQNLNRIAQEALSNIARHAKASRVEVQLQVADEIVTLSITDDGIGFDPSAATLTGTRSLGLVSMRERAELLGGALLIRSDPGKQTSIIAKIPIREE